MTPSIRSAAIVALFGLTLAVTSSCSSSSPTGGGAGGDFVLDIRYLGTAPTGATLASFEAAASTVRQTIVGALGVVTLPSDFTNIAQCDEDEPELAGFPDIPRNNIPGLVIYVIVAPIDGNGGTLGSAGPCLLRNNDIPALGVMLLDEADVANLQAAGQLPRVVLHEMMHVLGFGTVWHRKALLDSSNAVDARFVGPNARVACANVNGGGAACATSVPVHSTGGTGSAYTHWRESFFVNELMTPFLGAGANPLSATSVQSLKDLGYEVSNLTAENFTISGTELRAGTSSSVPLVAFGEPIRPRWKIDARGRKVPVR